MSAATIRFCCVKTGLSNLPQTYARTDQPFPELVFSTQGWYPATLLCTVLSALVEDKIYPDPYVGMNLRSIPGTTYPNL